MLVTSLRWPAVRALGFVGVSVFTAVLPATVSAAPSFPPLTLITSFDEVASFRAFEGIGDAAFLAVSHPKTAGGTAQRVLVRFDSTGAMTETPLTMAVDYVTSANGWGTVSGWDEAAQRYVVRHIDPSGATTLLFDAPYPGLPSWTYSHMAQFRGVLIDGRVGFLKSGFVAYDAAGSATTPVSFPLAQPGYVKLMVCGGRLFVVDGSEQAYLSNGSAATSLLTAPERVWGVACTGKRLLVRSESSKHVAFDTAGARQERSFAHAPAEQDVVELASGFVYVTSGKLYWSNGQTTGNEERELSDLGFGSVRGLAVGSKALFAAGDIVVTDGTAAGTETIGSPTGELVSSVERGSVAFFLYYHGETKPRFSLWSSDGTTGGTGKVADIPDAYDLLVGGSPLHYSQLALTSNALLVSATKKEVSGSVTLRVFRMPFPAASPADGGSPPANGNSGPDGGGAPPERGDETGPAPSAAQEGPTSSTPPSSVTDGGCSSARPRAISAIGGMMLGMVLAFSIARRRRTLRA